MSTALTSRAEVVTDAPARYAKQLGAHLGRKLTVREDDGVTVVVFDRGQCELLPREGLLLLSATAQDDEQMRVVEDVVGRHLEKFGARGALVVRWERG